MVKTEIFKITPGTVEIQNPDPKKPPIKITHDLLEVRTIAAIIRNVLFVQTKGVAKCVDTLKDGCIYLCINNAHDALLNYVIRTLAQEHFIYSLVKK